MGVISKPCRHCGSSDETANQYANIHAPSSAFCFRSNSAMLSSVTPVHGPFGATSGLNSAVIREKVPFTFSEIPTAAGSNSAVMREKAQVPAPNCFGVSLTVDGSSCAIMREKAPMPAPNRFSGSEIPIAGRSNSAVMPEKAPFTFGVSPTAGGLGLQDRGKSKCTGTFESTAPVPSLFSMSETPAYHFASHSMFHQTPKGPSSGFRANTSIPIPSPLAASGQYPVIKGSCTHGPPPNNRFANSLESILQNRHILNRQFPKPTSIFPQPAENPPLNQIPFVNAPACTNAPIFSWTTLPGFSASSNSETCRKERVFPFAPTPSPFDGPFAVLHSISALPGNEGSSHEELRWEHYQNNPMLVAGKVPVMMLPVIPMARGGYAILTVQSNLAQPSTIHQATEGGAASFTFPSGSKP